MYGYDCFLISYCLYVLTLFPVFWFLGRLYLRISNITFRENIAIAVLWHKTWAHIYTVGISSMIILVVVLLGYGISVIGNVPKFPLLVFVICLAVSSFIVLEINPFSSLNVGFLERFHFLVIILASAIYNMVCLLIGLGTTWLLYEPFFPIEVFLMAVSVITIFIRYFGFFQKGI